MRTILYQRKCKKCGLVFDVKTDGPNKKYCTFKCAMSDRKKKKPNHTCPICGKEFYRKPSQERTQILTCSPECAYEKRKKETYLRYQDPEKLCRVCGKLLSRGNKRYCSKKCQLIGKELLLEQGNYKSYDIIKKHLLKTRPYQCEECLLSEWKGNPIPLELHHIDGNSENNKKENLKLLCPNCHFFTPTYRSKNIGHGRVRRRVNIVYNSMTE